MIEWQKIKLGSFLTERVGKYKPTDKSIINLQRINKIDFAGNFFIATKLSNTDMILIKPNDFVISGIGIHNGSMGIYQGSKDIAATIHYSSYELSTEKINATFFANFIRTPKFLQIIKSQVRGGMRPEIKAKHLLPLEISLPPLAEQKRIAKYFSAIESKQQKLQTEVLQQKELIKKLRQQIIQEAIEGKLTQDWRKQNKDNIEPASKLLERIKTEKEKLIKEKKIKPTKELSAISESDKSFKLPKSWEWCRLGNITYGFEYGTSSKSLECGNTPVLRMININKGNIIWNKLAYTNDEEEIKKFKLSDGDLLFNRTNSRELVGKTGLYKGNKQAIFAGYLIRFRMVGKIISNYANFVMNSDLHSNWCNEVKSDAIGQSNINATKLSFFKFPLPPLAEQKAIADKVQKIMKICNELEQENQQNQERTKLLIQTLLSETFTQKTE